MEALLGEGPVGLSRASIMVIQKSDCARWPPADHAGRPAGAVAQAPVLSSRHRLLQHALGREVERRRAAVGRIAPVHYALTVRVLHCHTNQTQKEEQKFSEKKAQKATGQQALETRSIGLLSMWVPGLPFSSSASTGEASYR